MGDQTFNIGLGRTVELYNRVDINDPANAVLTLVVLSVTADQDAPLKDADTLSAVLALANVAEVTNTGYARVNLDDTDLTTFSPDDANDWVELDFPDQTFTAVQAGDAWTDIAVNYDPDSTGGTDANIIPLTLHDFIVTPNGGDITAQPSINGFFRAQ